MFLFVARLQGFKFLVGVLESPMSEIHDLKHHWVDAHPFVELVSMSGVARPYETAVDKETEALIAEYGPDCVRATIGKYTHATHAPRAAPQQPDSPEPWVDYVDPVEDTFSSSDNNASGDEYGSGSE
jgi:hypothetical protein